MKRTINILTILFLFTLASSFDKINRLTTGRQLTEQMLDSIKKIQTMRYTLKCAERINGKMIYGISNVKLNVSPRKLYMYLVGRGPELLYVQGVNANKVLVNPARFPYMNLSLEPGGALLRKNQHHTVNEVGYNYFANVLSQALRSAKWGNEQHYKIIGDVNWDNTACHALEMDNIGFKFSDHKIKNGEDLLVLAARYHVSEYMILEENKDKVSSFTDVTEGQIVKIPNIYAKKIVMYIGKKDLLPRNIMVFDDKGLYEYYEYHDIKVNTVIKAEEFTTAFKGYGF